MSIPIGILDTIREAEYGEQVRDAIADGLEFSFNKTNGLVDLINIATGPSGLFHTPITDSEYNNLVNNNQDIIGKVYYIMEG